jgi:hypothetical protein
MRFAASRFAGLEFAATMLAIVGAGCLVCGFASRSVVNIDAAVVVTSAPTYEPLAALNGKERFPNGATLQLFKDGRTQPLVPSFYATADADVSFDAKTVLFAAKPKATDKWQIWELTLADGALHKIVGSEGDAIRPLYLPVGRLVYAQRTPSGFELVAARLDGSATLPLTYLRGNELPATVLRDGRILFESTFPLGSGDTPEMYLVYSDGSGVESYRCDHGEARWGGRQLTSGDVVFTHGTTLARFTSPLAVEARVPAPLGEYAGAIVEPDASRWLLSVRLSPSQPYALKLWKPGESVMQTVLALSNSNLVEPVLVTARTQPNRHPSALHSWTTANLLALDARQSRDSVQSTVTPASVRMEALDATGHPVTMGTAPVETDGSFFVKVPGNRPIRFALLDANGAVIRQERGWFWSRGGEQRICVGCHTGPEHAPENRVPQVLLHNTTPVDLSGSDSAAMPYASLPGGN